MQNAVSASMSMKTDATATQASASMLKKSLDFQGDMVNSLINDSTSQIRTESMQKSGKGRKLDITA